MMLRLSLFCSLASLCAGSAACGSSAGPEACKPRTQASALIQLQPALSRAEEDEVSEYDSTVVQQRMSAAGAGTVDMQGSACPHSAARALMSADDIVAAGGDVVLPAGSYILRSSASVAGLTIPSGSELVFDDKPGLVLNAEGVHVLGTMRLGSKSCPLEALGVGITFTGSGDRGSKSSNPLQTKGLVVGQGGVLEMFGVRYAPTWTRLAASAAPGSSSLQLGDAVDWQVGQQVVVVTTAWTDEPDMHENEVRTIVSVDADGRKLLLDRALDHGHYGGQEYAAEVALLSRSITLSGDEGSEATRYGGHLLCGPGSRCQIGGVAAFRMGQENMMGRYPFHLHMMGYISGESFFEDCLVLHSFFRAFTIHGTSRSRVSRNVAYDVSGSAYYLEDGIEEENLFDFNLAAHIHIIDQLADYEAGGGQSGVSVHTEPTRIVPTDATAVGFYCTNAKNRWVGNSASGGFSGFHFPQVPHALGLSYAGNQRYEPEAQELLQFDSNTAHSSGRVWSRGACIYIGGRLWEETKGSSDLSYITGRYQPARKSGRFIFTNTRVFACGMGTLFWGTYWTANKPDFALNGFEAHDVKRSSSQLGDTYMLNAVVSAHSGNSLASDLPQVTEGFELYDTDMQTILVNVTFRNFDRPGDVAIMDMTHSNIFKPQGMFHSKGLHFDGTPRGQRFRHVERLACKSYHSDICLNRCSDCPGTPGSSQTANIIDVDGSAVGWDRGGAILGADDTDAETNGRTNDWWRLDDDCVSEAAWGFWACPTHDYRTVVSLFIVKGIASGAPQRTTSSTAVGQLYHFGHEDRHLDLGLAQSPMVTGPCCDIGWFMRLDSGAERELTIFLDQMVTQSGLVFATAYPPGAELAVQRCLPNCQDVAAAGSLQEVLDAPGTLYYMDSQGRLFLKFLFEGNGFFEAGGVSQLQNGHRYYAGQGARYTIRSSKAGLVDWQLPAAFSAPMTSGAPTSTSRVMTITTSTSSTSTSTIEAASTSTPASSWEIVDSGAGRACRGATVDDNAASYYTVLRASSLNGCKAHCESISSCQGIEYHSSGRCEVWTRSEGIQAFRQLDGYSCLRYGSLLASTSLGPVGDYEPIDGGSDRACRGVSSSDNSAEYYVLHSGTPTLEHCKAKCARNSVCQGLEYNSAGRCEVWTRPNGIQASRAVAGYTCLRLLAASTTTTTRAKTTSTSGSWTSSSPASCSKVWEKCGGENWSGQTCCVQGTACVFGNKWHSQCKPQ